MSSKPKQIISPKGGYCVLQWADRWVEYYPTTDGLWAVNCDGVGQFPGYPADYESGCQYEDMSPYPEE